MVVAEYPHLKQQKLFYVSPDTMRWRVTYDESGGWSVWSSGADHEPEWDSAATYQVEPIPTPVCYQPRILVPAPERVAPMKGTDYYVPANTSVERWKWCDIECDKRFLRDGLVYLRYEDAEARRQAWLKLEEE